MIDASTLVLQVHEAIEAENEAIEAWIYDVVQGLLSDGVDPTGIRQVVRPEGLHELYLEDELLGSMRCTLKFEE